MKKVLLVLSYAVVLSACTKTVLPFSTQVYINSGAIQCESEGQTGAETARLLTLQNIAVSRTQCGHLSNVAIMAMCGSLTSNINVHTISAADLEKALWLGFENVNTLKQGFNSGYDVGECKK